METRERRAPMTGRGYSFSVPLESLPIGTRFMLYTETPSWGLLDDMQFGTLLWVGSGSCEVWFDSAKEPCRVTGGMDVWILDEEPLGWELTEQYFWYNTNYPGKGIEGRELTAEEKEQMAEQVAALSGQAKALIARYNYQLKTLQEALDSDNKAQASVIMTRLDKCILEAKQTNVPLPDPPEALAGYTPLIETLTKAREEQASKAQTAAAKIEAASGGDAKAARAIAVDRHKTEAKTEKAAREPKPKAEKKLRPCLDGCGAMVPGNFAMGHDAKLKSLLIKVERGEKPLTDIPEIVLDLVKIQKGEAIQERDGQGNPKGEPKQTYRITAAPVRFPGRDDVALTKRED